MSTAADIARPTFDSRQYLLDRERGIKAETQAIDQLQHYTLLGYGMAEFAKAMYEGLSTGENAISPMVLTSEQKLRLVCAALQGR
jgi:hypothetical protein